MQHGGAARADGAGVVQGGQRVLRGGELLCDGRVRVAALSADSFRPMAIPDFMFERLAAQWPGCPLPSGSDATRGV